MDLESYGPPDHLEDPDYRYDDGGGYEHELQEVERPRGRPDRMRPRGGRWNRDDEPGRRVRSRSREREHWDDYDDYEGYEERDSRDRRDRYRDRGRDERYRDRDDRFYSDRDRERVGRDRRDRGRNRRRRSSDRYDREDDYRSRDYDYEDNDRYRNSRSGSEVPTTLVMMRGLPYSATEEDVTAVLQHGELAYRDIKIIKDKQGESRGFGFVEFHDVKEAEKWMYISQGSFVVLDRTVHLEYGKPRPTEQDWACSKCGTLNYASRRRTTCFSCGAPKEEAAEDPYNYDDYCNDSYYDEDSLSSSGGCGSQKDRDAPAQAPPCNILIMRGLDVNTTEETVRNNIVQVADIPIYDVRLIKDKVSGVSRGFCFIELGSTEDATKLLDVIQAMDPPYSVENKKVLVGYARNTLHPPPSKPKSRSDSKPPRQRNAMHAGNTKIANTAIAQAQAAQAQGYYDQQQVQGQQFAQGTPASQQTTGPQATQAQHSRTGYNQGQDSTAGEASQQQYQQYQQYYQQAGGSQQGGQVQPQQGQMFHQMYDISSFTYDQNTGYYYDPNSSLYYDVNTGYHYNGTTGQFLYWEPNQQQYYVVNQDGSLSAPFTAAGGTTSNSQDFGTDPNKDKDKVPHKPSGASARKIAKDMERWAKKMNEATAIKQTAVRQAMQELKAQELREEALRKQMEDEGVFKKPQLPTVAAPASKKVKSLFTPDEDGESPLLGGTQKPKKQSLVAEYGGDDSDDETDVDNKFIDLNKLACLLCQRKFGNRETLLKHQQLSDLHKQNLEKYKKSHAT